MSHTRQVIRNIMLFLFLLFLAMGFFTKQSVAQENTGYAYGINVTYQDVSIYADGNNESVFKTRAGGIDDVPLPGKDTFS